VFGLRQQIAPPTPARGHIRHDHRLGRAGQAVDPTEPKTCFLASVTNRLPPEILSTRGMLSYRSSAAMAWAPQGVDFAHATAPLPPGSPAQSYPLSR